MALQVVNKRSVEQLTNIAIQRRQDYVIAIRAYISHGGLAWNLSLNLGEPEKTIFVLSCIDKPLVK
jgi:hypothetical protein